MMNNSWNMDFQFLKLQNENAAVDIVFEGLRLNTWVEWQKKKIILCFCLPQDVVLKV